MSLLIRGTPFLSVAAMRVSFATFLVDSPQLLAVGTYQTPPTCFLGGQKGSNRVLHCCYAMDTNRAPCSHVAWHAKLRVGMKRRSVLYCTHGRTQERGENSGVPRQLRKSAVRVSEEEKGIMCKA